MKINIVCFLKLVTLFCYPQLKKWPTYSKMEKDSLINSEEGIVYSQAIHYANRMVYMRIPLDASEKMPAPTPTPALGLVLLTGLVLSSK